MSDKMNGAVWDLKCHQLLNGIEFKPGHKFVLLAYADHADHNGENIYPAVITIAAKTGYEERSIQRITRDLEEMGVLLESGRGPHGTNKWKLSLDKGGDKISPLNRGDKMTPNRGDIPSGDIPSGDIPSGDKISPESINKNKILNELEKLFHTTDWFKKFNKYAEEAEIYFDEENNWLVVQHPQSELLQSRFSSVMNRNLAVTTYKKVYFIT